MSGVPASSHGSTFNGGTITGALTVSPATGGNDALLIHADPADTVNTEFEVDQHGNLFIRSGGAFQEAILDLTDNTAGNPGHIRLDTYAGAFLSPEGSPGTILQLSPTPLHTGKLMQATNVGGSVVTEIPVTGGIATKVIASGALPTVAPVTATAFQCSTSRDVFLSVPVTYNPGVATTATCKVELSPDNITFSELFTVTQPVGTVFDGSVEAVQLIVPAAWRVKLTVTNATLGTGTYY